MYKILKLGLLLSGCSLPEDEYRVVCDDFKTKWIKHASVSGGIIYWSDKSLNVVGSRKMMLGETCNREKRRVN